MKKVTVLFIASLFISFSLIAQKPVHIEKSGKGTPVLFLPGFTNPGSIWEETAEKMQLKTENHFVSYAGFNGHDAITFPWYPQLVESLVDYIKTEDLKELIIIGHSMGGNVAIDLAAALPGYVDKLVLVESIPCMREVMMPGVPASSLAYESPYNKRTLEMKNEDFGQIAANQAMYMTNDSTKVEQLTNWILEADRETYVFGYTDLLKLDLRNTLKEIKAQSLILGASFPNPAIMKQNYEKQYANLSDKQIHIASNSKHFIMFDEFDWMIENINNFLADAE